MRCEMLLSTSLFLAFGQLVLLGGPNQSIPVRVKFRDAVNDRIQSDGNPLYLDADQGVSASIDSASGQFSLRTCVSTNPNRPCVGRASYLDFTSSAEDILGDQALPGSDGLGLPFAADIVASSWVLTPRDENDEVLAGGLLSMVQPGEVRLGGLKINFRNSSGDLYTIRFSPQNWPDSSRVLITFLGGDLNCQVEGACASWRVESFTGRFTDPSDLCCAYTEIMDVGTLVSENANDEGDYHLPLSITITALPKSSDGGSGGGGNGGGKGGGNK